MKKRHSRDLDAYRRCLLERGSCPLDSVDPSGLDRVDYRRKLGQALMPRVLMVAMEWAEADESVARLVKKGNRALFAAMRDYREERDGALYDYLTETIENSIAER